MNEPAVFRTVLTVLGFNTIARRNEITGQGILTCNDLAALTASELEQVFTENRSANRRRTAPNQVVIPIPSKSRLEALRYEFDLRQTCQSPMAEATLLDIDLDIARIFVQQKQEREDAKRNADALPTVDVPKLDKQNWRSFRDAFHEFLSRQIGSNGIPLLYVVRENEAGGDYDSAYPTLNDKLVSCISLIGTKYVADNNTVYSFLSTYLKDSQAESTVKRFNRARSGRECWKALKVHFESESYKSTMKTTAIANIRASEYTGPKKTFNLSSLYLIHTNAHNMLEEAGLPYSESQKIQEFQSCLKEKIAIEKSVGCIMALGINPTFETYYNSLNGQVSAIITLSEAASSAKNNTRTINEITTGGGRGRGRGRGRGGRSSGRGRGAGRGRGRGREGRGRGGSRFQPYDSNSRWQPRLGAYTDDEWYNLTQEQKSRVFDLRNAADSHDTHARSINQVTFADDQSLPSQIPAPATQSDAPLPPPPPTQPVLVPASRGSVGSSFSQPQRGTHFRSNQQTRR